jgi:hypothetical protein
MIGICIWHFHTVWSQSDIFFAVGNFNKSHKNKNNGGRKRDNLGWKKLKGKVGVYEINRRGGRKTRQRIAIYVDNCRKVSAEKKKQKCRTGNKRNASDI